MYVCMYVCNLHVNRQVIKLQVAIYMYNFCYVYFFSTMWLLFSFTL